MKSRRTEKGVADWVVVVGVLVVLAVIGLAVAATMGRDTVPPSQVPGAENTCFTSCLGFVELQCGDNEVIGACFGVWGCDAQIGAHQCR